MTDYILWVLLGWIGFCPWFLFFLHITCSCIIMHCTFFFLLSYALKFLLWLCFFLSYLSLSFSLLVMAPKKVVPSKSLICRGSSSWSFPLILFGFVMKRHIMTSLRTFLIGWFIQNARSFCLISQTLLYPVLLALKDGLLLMRNPQGVPMCSYKSFTPICTSSIPLYLGLLRYFMVHVS